MEQKKLYYIMNFFFSMTMLGICTQVPYYASMRFNSTSVQLAKLSILFGSTYIVLAVVMGQVGSKIKNKETLLTLGCFGLLLTSVYVFFVPNMKLLYVYPLMLSVSISLFYPNIIGSMGQANSMWMVSRQAALFSIGWALPLTIAPIIAGSLFEIFRRLFDMPQLVFPAAGLLALVAGIISFKVQRLNFRRSMNQPVEVEEVDRSKLPAGGVLFLLLALFCIFSVRSPTSILFNLFPRHAYGMGFSALRVGSLLSFFGLSQVGMFWFLSKRHFWHFRQSPFYVSAGIMIIGMALMSVAKSYIMMAGLFILFGCSGAISYHQSMFYSLIVSKNKSRAGGIHESLLVMGNMITLYLAATRENQLNDPGAAYHVGAFVCVIFLLVIAMTSVIMRTRMQAAKAAQL